LARLDARIRKRVDNADVEFMSGIEAWTIRVPIGTTLHDLRQRLNGLPVEIAEDKALYAL
jgi:hypothetical protein